MLSNLNLEYLEIKTYPGSVYEVNNFYYLDKDINLSDNWASRVYEMFLPYLEKPAKYRKAYISRSSIQDRKLENLPAGLDVYDDNRIYDEDLIEDFFRKRGYDIVNPEAFDKYIDQANFFHSCKVIAGVTGSGLFNVTFMQPGSTVLEIQTPLVINSENQNMAVQELQYDYTLTSYQKGHRHISIPNPTRMSKDIIEMMSDIVV
jgi:capsular polysaccharide biosynthesis protein